MTIQQFELFNNTEKEEALWEDGVFMITFDEGNNLCDVYGLFDFYVSLCYQLSVNKKGEIVAAINPDELPYLQKINKIL